MARIRKETRKKVEKDILAGQGKTAEQKWKGSGGRPGWIFSMGGRTVWGGTDSPDML